MAEVQMKASHLIKPRQKKWNTGTMMKLTELDMRLGRVFVPSVYVYGPNKEWDPASMYRNIKESLEKVVTEFYPFAGRLKPTEGGRMDLVLDEEADTWGVHLLVAETAIEVAELGDLVQAEEMGRLKHLLPIVDFMNKPLPEIPLLTVQLTHFRCGGVALALTLSHVVTDGVGAGHFFTEWTRLARGETLGMAPVHDRSLLRAGEPPRSVSDLSQEEVTPSPPPMIPPPTANGPPQIISLKLPVSKSQINYLKKAAGHPIGGGHPYSRFEVLTALAWRCAKKVRAEEGKKIDALSFGMDIRKRMNPPLPLAFNGNSVIMMTVTSDSEDLISKPLGYACGKIRQTIEKVTDDYVNTYLDYEKSRKDLGVRETPMTQDGLFVNPTVIMISWFNLKLFKLDFGWGTELHMASSPQAFEGVACLLHGEEEGSAIVVLCLQVAHEDKFKEYFFGELGPN